MKRDVHPVEPAASRIQPRWFVAAALALLAMSTTSFAVFTPFFDDFTTFDSTLVTTTVNGTSTTWNTYLNPSGTASAAANGSGQLVLNAGNTTSGSRALAISSRSDFNFFNQALTFQLKISDLGGAPYNLANSARGQNTQINHFLLIGQSAPAGANDSPARYLPSFSDTNNFADGVWFKLVNSALSDTPNAPVKWWLEACGVANGGTPPAGERKLLELTGEPTDLKVTLEGTGAGTLWSVQLTGANFVSGSSDTFSGLFTNVTAGVFTSGVGVDDKYRIALGSRNFFTVYEPAVGSFDSISVTVVPEPSMVGLLGAVGLLALRRRRM